MFRIKRKFALIPREVWSKKKGHPGGECFKVWFRFYYVIQWTEPAGWITMGGHYKYIYETEAYWQLVNCIKWFHELIESPKKI